MKTQKKIYIICLMFGIFMSSFAFKIDSTDFDQRIDTGGYKEFTFENNTEQTIRYKFDIKKGNSDKDMSKWVTVYPKVMNIPPLEKRVLKVHAKSPENSKVGEYSFKLVTTPLVIPTLREEKGKIVGNSTISFVPSIEMKGYVGDANFKENLLLTDSKFSLNENKKVEYSATIENKSFAGIEVGLKFVSWNGNIIDGKWIGRANSGIKEKFKFELSEKVKKIDEIKEIVIYDANSLVNIKTIKL